MSDLKFNGIMNKPVKAELTTKKTEKKSEAARTGTTGRQSVTSASGQPPERRIDRLILSEQARAAARSRAAGQVIDGAAQRAAGESEEHWMRRLISCETAGSWRAGSRQWQEESKDMGIADRVRYRGQKATEWVTDLMEHEPAMFREWLNREQWHMEEGDLENAILPKGFTAEDFSRWMEKDVLDYL